MSDASEPSSQSSPARSQQNHSLSDISHLFLSSVRQRQTQGAPLPKRRPPGQHVIGHDEHSSYSAGTTDRARPSGHLSIDLTPEEFSQVFNGAASSRSDAEMPRSQERGAEDFEVRIPPIAAILGGHLNGSYFDRARQYARHLAQSGLRIGMICVDASEFRLMCCDCPPQGAEIISEERPASDYFEAREMTAALHELSWDLDRWLLVLPTPRTCEARKLLREADHWVLLSTCDHDGLISAYRTLKGVSELLQGGEKPRLTLALLDAPGGEQSERIHRKLSGVCEQFLHWPLESEPDVCGRSRDAEYADDRGFAHSSDSINAGAIGDPAARVAEHLVLCCRPTRDKAQLAMAPQWNTVAQFLRSARAQQEPSAAAQAEEPSELSSEELSLAEEPMNPPQTAQAFAAGANMRYAASNDSAARMAPQKGDSESAAMSGSVRPLTPSVLSPVKSATSDVIDLPDGSESAIVEAVLRSEPGALVECPLSPPMNSAARLAVDRQRGLLLLAIARPGLSELKSIAQAYAWVVENRVLIGMAMPQMSIDGCRHPRLRLLVDHADISADGLAPMLQSQSVSVQAYRKVRWGEKTGLLLEAA